MSQPQSRLILGSRIDATTYEGAWVQIGAWIGAQTWGYVIAANVHVVMTGIWQPDFQTILNQAALVTPDGMPLVWTLRLLGVKYPQRVYGPDLMLAGCAWAADQGYAIYLYGSTDAGLKRLQARLTTEFPTLKIAGMQAPAFRPQFHGDDPDLRVDCQRMAASGAKIVFVGLGCPKQEYWMATFTGQIPAMLIGVGAAFDFHSGQIRQAPRWMMGLGLEWLYRLLQEPQRLWQRYLINNPVFVLLLAWQIFNQWRQQASKHSICK